jgi:hypothetical protein
LLVFLQHHGMIQIGRYHHSAIARQFVEPPPHSIDSPIHCQWIDFDAEQRCSLEPYLLFHLSSGLSDA